MCELATSYNSVFLLLGIVAALVCGTIVIIIVTAMLMAYIGRKVITTFEKYRNLSIFMLCLLIFGAIAIPIIHLAYPSFIPSLTLEDLGKIADYFGGVIGTLIAAIVAIYAIRTYKSERKYQKEAEVSARLSAMLELHKQNVNEIEVTYYHTATKKYRGRGSFEVFYKELEEIYNIVEEAIKSSVNLQSDKYQNWVSLTRQRKLAHAISYGYFFYDVGSYLITYEVGTPLFDLGEEVRKKAQEKIPEKMQNLQRHVILGHYFRHLFNMVNFIDKSDFTDKYDKKEFYVKLIRSQLSDYEQILLYYNSLSTLGYDWNLPLGEKKIKDMSLIGKYRLLKNCPLYIEYFGIHPTKIYQIEDQAWKNERNELFFETDPQGQKNAFDKIMESSIIE